MSIKISRKQIRYALVFLFIWILVGFNTGNADSTQYVAMFNAATNGNFYYAEKGFLLLCMLFGKAGFDYQVFLAMYSFVALVLISSFVKENTRYPALALTLYGIFPFLFDAVQIRNLMVEALFLFSIKFLKEKTLKNAIMYTLFILLAATQHTIAIIYLVFLLVYVKEKRKVALISIVGSLSFVVLYRTYLGTIISLFTSNRHNYAFADAATSLSTVIKYFLYFGVLVLIGIFVSRREKHYRATLMKQTVNGVSQEDEFWEKIMLISICLITFIIVDGNYTRLFRNCLIIYYCRILNVNTYRTYRDNKIIIAVIIAFAIVGWLKNFAPGIYYYDTITNPILHNNIVFGWFLK